MKITKITLQQTFPTGPYENVKLGVEADINDSDPGYVKNCYRQLETILRDCFKGLAVSQAPPEWVKDHHPITTQPLKEVQIEKPSTESTITDIQNCKDLAELDTYRLVAALDPKVKEVYDEKYLQLYNNQITK